MDGGRIAEWLGEESTPIEGWDFSHLEGRWTVEEPPWSYRQQAREAAAGATRVLDIGTGGGEWLSGIRDRLPSAVFATEGHPPNLEIARSRLTPLGVRLIRCGDSVVQPLPFRESSFELVMDRRTAYSTREAARILTPGGTFVTEQMVGNLHDLTRFFGREPLWPFFTAEYQQREAEKAGLRLRRLETHRGALTFHDVGALVWFLRAAFWIVPGFSVRRDLDRLLELQRRVDRGEPLRFTEGRTLLVADRPEPLP